MRTLFLILVLASTSQAAIEIPDYWCKVDTVKVADCVPLNFNYAIGETQIVYWKDCDGFTYSKDFLPDDSWDYFVFGDQVVENSGGIYTKFKSCEDIEYAYFYRECPENHLPEPTSAVMWLLGLLCTWRFRQ